MNCELMPLRRFCVTLAALAVGVALPLAGSSAAAEQAEQAEQAQQSGHEAAPAHSGPRTVVITGSNRGIGLGFAKWYAEQGWNVVATCRRPEQADDLNALAAEHDNLSVEQLDVTSEEQIAALAERHAGRPIDLLINNAGILGELPRQALGGLDYDSFTQIMAVNVFGPLRISEALTENVVAAGGKIVAITSGLASITLMERLRGFYFYRISKAGLNMGWRALRTDLQPRGVTVMLVSPGMVETRLLEQSGYRGPALTTDESVAAMAEIIANGSLEDPVVSINVDGQVLPW